MMEVENLDSNNYIRMYLHCTLTKYNYNYVDPHICVFSNNMG